MGILNRLSVVDGGAREYALVRRSGQPDDPSKIKSYDRPKSPHEVELEEDLPVGNYYLQIIKKNGDFGKQEWSETLFGSESELESVKEQARRAEERAEEAKSAASKREAAPAKFDDPNDALRFEIRRGIVESEALMQLYGDRVIEWAFSGGDPSISYEIENEWQAWMHDLRRNPEQAKAQLELAQSVAKGLGRAGARGVVEGLEGDGAAGGGDGGHEQPDGQAVVDDDRDGAAAFTPRRSSEAVAVDLETLGEEPATGDDGAGQAAADDDEAGGGGGGPSEPSTAETGDVDDATDDDIAGGGLDETMSEIEEEIDREAGEYPNAAEAMERLGEAAEGDDDG